MAETGDPPTKSVVGGASWASCSSPSQGERFIQAKEDAWKILKWLLLLTAIHSCIFYPIYGYALHLALDAQEDSKSAKCTDIADWLVVWASFAIASLLVSSILASCSYCLTVCRQLPSKKTEDRKIVDDKLALQVEQTTFCCKGMMSLFSVGNTVFVGYWLVRAELTSHLLDNYLDCGEMGRWAEGLWIFSTIFAGLLGVLIGMAVVIPLCTVVVCVSANARKAMRGD